MYKILLPMALLLTGCANFTVNGTLCDQIASEPGAIIPKECRAYNEQEAEKAFNKVDDEKKIADKDLKVEKEEE